ncbi:aminoacyl-tRNA hydrolase [Mycetocola tolaasinivorans]|uniref:Peptidyl-tRNA hydrolase n=1 Tax=Mycetocola tolaasinivorans TaxID=76635 RepID=A0A3L7A0S3_9MICO|nr:aminoacyl-tRNA hydrolase [Mycetocola tolaasinivorans]RLP73674.1 aminoacyl-tRNA hydrolase [Mycetocola tolaasinivorans]
MAAANTWLVIGLGNPGPRYERTRHNIGQMVIAELSRRLGQQLKRHRSAALVAEGFLHPGGPKLIVATLTSFMNVSGKQTAALASFYSIPPERIIVVHDEMDIPFDTIKLKIGGGHGGHNGLRDIAAALGTPEFVRVRTGIGRPDGRQDPADFVLAPFSSTERETLPILIGDAADAAELVATDGLTAAQLRFHTRS